MVVSSMENTIDLTHTPTVLHNMSMPRHLTANPAPRTVSSTPQNKRPRDGDEADSANESSKRVARVLSNQGLQPLRIPTVPLTLSPQANGYNFVAIPRSATNEHVKENQNPTKIYIIGDTACAVTKLQEENAHLKSENASLKKQVSLFKQLMRNPQRLQSVIQRLNEKQNQQS